MTEIMSRVREYYQRHIDAETPEQTVERIRSVSEKVRKPLSTMSVIKYVKRSEDLIMNDGRCFKPTQPDELLEYLFDNSLSHTIVDVREYMWGKNGTEGVFEVVLAESLDGTTNITPEVIEELTMVLRRYSK